MYKLHSSRSRKSDSILFIEHLVERVCSGRREVLNSCITEGATQVSDFVLGCTTGAGAIEGDGSLRGAPYTTTDVHFVRQCLHRIQGRLISCANLLTVVFINANTLTITYYLIIRNLKLIC